MKLCLDANVIIYAHEADPPLRELVLQRLVDWCGKPNGSLITSLLSRLECLVVPLRTANASLLTDYDLFFRGDAVEVIEISREILDIGAKLRAQYAFRSPDAIHLATAFMRAPISSLPRIAPWADFRA